MTEINPEEYREELQALYKESNKKRSKVVRDKYDSCDLTEDKVFDEVSYFKDGEKEFIIGRYHKEEKDIQNPYTNRKYDKYTYAENILFVGALENKKLSGTTLKISAVSEKAHLYYVGYDPCGPVSDKSEDMSCVDISIKSAGSLDFFYRSYKNSYSSLDNPSEIVNIVMSNKRRKDKSTALEICNRFIEPKEVSLRFAKAEKDREKAEQERLKRVKRFGELRKKVEAKRAKLAAKQTEKERLLRNQQARDGFSR